MRITTNSWTVSSGVKTGHGHLFKGTNCQDSADFFANDEIVCGIGCDGCSEGNYSEVGARMLCVYALSEVARMHRMGFNLARITDNLFASVVRFIQSQVFHLAGPACYDSFQIAEYIKNHWLATMIGFIVQGDNGVIFSCGDGVYELDGTRILINQNNFPKYIAYQAVKDPEMVGVTAEVLPTTFQVEEFDAARVKRIMIASDGFCHHNERMMEINRQKSFCPTIPSSLNAPWGKHGHYGLKKWMNVRSSEGYFEDDCFIVTAERTSA